MPVHVDYSTVFMVACLFFDRRMVLFYHDIALCSLFCKLAPILLFKKAKFYIVWDYSYNYGCKSFHQ